MTRDRIAVLDVGTSRVKGAVYPVPGAPGVEPFLVDAPLAPPRLEGHRAEQDLADVVRAVNHVLAQLAAVSPPRQWTGLSVTTQRGTLVLGDAAGRPMTRLWSWLDRRGLEVGGDRWDWAVQCEPELAARTVRMWSLASWLVQAMTGKAVESAQTRPGEMGRKDLAAVAMSAVVLPGHVVEVGGGHEQSAFPALRGTGVPLVIAGGDKNAELVGAGCVAPGAGVVSFGTAVSLGVLVVNGTPPAGTVYATPAHVPGLTQMEVGLPFGGGVWEWLGALLGRDATLALATLDPDDLRPVFLPYLTGSLTDGAAAGAWVGLRPSHGPMALVASGLEGILLDLAQARPALPSPLTKLALVGGGGHNRALPQALADLLGAPVAVAQTREAGLLGGGMTAAVGLGLSKDWTAAAAHYGRAPAFEALPRPEMAAGWARRRSRFEELTSRNLAFPGPAR